MSTSPVGGGLKPGSRKEKEEASAKESLQRVGAASKLKGAAKKMMVVGTLTSTPDTVRTSVAVVRKKDEVVVHKKGWRGSPVHYAAAAGRLDLLIPLWKDDVEHEIGEEFFLCATFEPSSSNEVTFLFTTPPPPRLRRTTPRYQ